MTNCNAKRYFVILCNFLLSRKYYNISVRMHFTEYERDNFVDWTNVHASSGLHKFEHFVFFWVLGVLSVDLMQIYYFSDRLNYFIAHLW